MIHDTIYLNKLTILVCCIQGLFGPHDCFHFLGPPLIQQHYKTAKMIKIHTNYNTGPSHIDLHKP